MPKEKVLITEGSGFKIYKERNVVRSIKDFDVENISDKTKTSFKLKCQDEDFKNILECLLTTAVLEDIIR